MEGRRWARRVDKSAKRLNKRNGIACPGIGKVMETSARRVHVRQCLLLLWHVNISNSFVSRAHQVMVFFFFLFCVRLCHANMSAKLWRYCRAVDWRFALTHNTGTKMLFTEAFRTQKLISTVCSTISTKYLAQLSTHKYRLFCGNIEGKRFAVTLPPGGLEIWTSLMASSSDFLNLQIQSYLRLIHGFKTNHIKCTSHRD